MPRAFLEVRTAQAPEPRVDLPADRLTIGRNADNLLVITDTAASRYHAAIDATADGWVLCDLKSRNGTRVNGKLVERTQLIPGDEIRIGQTALKFRLAQEADDAEGVGAGNLDFNELLQLADAEVAVESDPVGHGELDSPERSLYELAAGLPAAFTENDIVILNARAQIAHASTSRSAEPGDPVHIFRLLLLVCFRSGASDIHIEPKENNTPVRIRVDGSMIDACLLPRDVGTRMLSMIKILCDLDIAQRNAVQEGSFAARVPQGRAVEQKIDQMRRVDYRISFAPSVHGQKLVIRIQDTGNAPALLGDLNLPAWMAEEIGLAMSQDSGMVLSCGPTGSGKTTTLYSLLRSINVHERNIVTIENPVEIQIPGITQLPVDEAHDKTFTTLLKSVLRQDPDVILVGEIRDPETAKTAMQAAITGHLVLSTIHTKDSLGTVYRLLDLGVEPFLLAQGLSTVVAQRLVRKLCPSCKKPAKATSEQKARLAKAGVEADQLYQAVGCKLCLGTGYRGRQAVFELLSVNEDIRDAIARNEGFGALMKAVSESRFVKLLYSGYALVAAGLVPMEEVERTIGR